MSKPVWIEIDQNSLSVSQLRGWPYFELDDHPVAGEMVELPRSFISTDIDLFKGATDDPEGWLYLQHAPKRGYFRGIWIPHTFPSLNTVIELIMQTWKLEVGSLDQWIQNFFALRLQPDYFEFYQVQESYSVNLPPLFVLSPQQVRGALLHHLREQVDGIGQITKEVLERSIKKILPSELLQLLAVIHGEKELTQLHLLLAYLYTISDITVDEFRQVEMVCNAIAPDTFYLVIFGYLLNRVAQRELDPDLVNLIQNRVDQLDGMDKILAFRFLTQYFKVRGEIVDQETYYQALLKHAPKSSWNTKLDLINAQLGLARCSVRRGDYFRAMTFYSFARQGFSILGSTEITKEMDLEFKRISILAASQQLQFGLYEINHGNLTKNSFLILLDGMQNALAYYLRHQEAVEIERILPPLLQSSAHLLQLHQAIMVDLYTTDVNIDELIQTIELLSDPTNQEQIRERLQFHIEQLSYKDQKMVEKITVFHEDGRHIGDYHLQQGRFTPVQQDPNQSLFSSAMSAVGMLVSEATQSDDSVDEITVGNKTVIYETGDYLTFCLIAKSSSSNLKNLLKKVVRTAEQRFAPFLQNWSGNLNQFSGMTDILSPLSFFAIDLDDTGTMT